MHAPISIAVVLSILAAVAGCQNSDESAARQMTSNGLSGQSMMGHGTGYGMMSGGMMDGSAARHHWAMMNGLPQTYASLRDPLPDTAATLQRGASVYQQNCAACHGTRGYGDGPVGQQLNPRPANLVALARMPMGRSDPYLYWSIAEGGQRFGTAMPSFKGSLSDSDTWAVIAYVRHGLPENRSSQ